MVLSAWCCGAFRTPPLHQAYLFKQVFEEKEFVSKFKVIVFAILNDHNAHRFHNPQGNLNVLSSIWRINCDKFCHCGCRRKKDF